MEEDSIFECFSFGLEDFDIGKKGGGTGTGDIDSDGSQGQGQSQAGGKDQNQGHQHQPLDSLKTGSSVKPKKKNTNYLKTMITLKRVEAAEKFLTEKAAERERNRLIWEQIQADGYKGKTWTFRLPYDDDEQGSDEAAGQGQGHGPVEEQVELDEDESSKDNEKGKFKKSRELLDPSVVFHHNAWDNVEWDEEMETDAKSKIAINTQNLVDSEMTNLYSTDASKFWDQFYGIHQNKFFKQRNWLFTEFPDLMCPLQKNSPKDSAGRLSTFIKEKRSNETFPGENSNFRILEVGCGNGSTVFPLLEANTHPEAYVYCCDFSSSAVDIVNSDPKFMKDRCTCFVWDVTSDLSNIPFPPGSIDVITLIFVLSAVSPDNNFCVDARSHMWKKRDVREREWEWDLPSTRKLLFERAIQNLYKLLKPGGKVLFRDYGMYDLVQLRFPDGRCISDNFYVRGDGTRVYFFTQDEVESLFHKVGFETATMLVDKRLQVNRGKQLKMYRIWVQAKFRRKE